MKATHGSWIRASAWRASISLCALLLGGLVATPAPVAAACGGGPDETWLARYAGRHADTIVLGRLIEQDSDRNYHFEILEVYRGEVVSPIIDGWPGSLGVVDAGGCTGRSVEPGRLFVYAEGDRERFALMQLIFPHDPGQGFIVSHHRAYRSLDGLLALLGVLPDTATAAPKATADSVIKPHLGAVVAALLALTWVFIRPFGGATRAAQRLLRPAADE